MIDVLVVEDDPTQADAHRRYVERIEGFAASGVVHTARATVDHLAAHHTDLLLLDLRLPDADGIELCRYLRERDERVDVIAVTSTRNIDTVRAAVSLGILQYLIKPFTFAVFREKLERYSQYRRLLHDDVGPTSQDEVDRALTLLRGSVEAPLPKGLSRNTLSLILDQLRRAGDVELSAEEMAAAVGVSRVTARRYLEHLTEQGGAQRSLRYGRTGRPQQRYRILH
jgi:response regulator of citrate/malate metabolism